MPRSRSVHPPRSAAEAPAASAAALARGDAGRAPRLGARLLSALAFAAASSANVAAAAETRTGDGKNGEGMDMHLFRPAIDSKGLFSVNGASKGTMSTLKLQVKPGSYSVTCKPSTGATKSKSVTVTGGGSAMAMFKLQ